MVNKAANGMVDELIKGGLVMVVSAGNSVCFPSQQSDGTWQ